MKNAKRILSRTFVALLLTFAMLTSAAAEMPSVFQGRTALPTLFDSAIIPTADGDLAYRCGDVDGEGGVTIFDALEILKKLVNMDCVIVSGTDALKSRRASLLVVDSRNLGSNTTTPNSCNPSIFDALEILKKLVNMSGVIKDTCSDSGCDWCKACMICVEDPWTGNFGKWPDGGGDNECDCNGDVTTETSETTEETTEESDTSEAETSDESTTTSEEGIYIPPSDTTTTATTTTEATTTEATTITEASTTLDPDDPTGQITIKDNRFTSFFNMVTFGMFFKDTVDVTITTPDADKIEYVLSETQLNSTTNWGAVAWTTYTAPFSIPANFKGYIYARFTKTESGRWAVINSDGLVVYTDSSVNDNTINYTKGSYDDKSVNVTFNGNTVMRITRGTTQLQRNIDYTVSGNQIIFSGDYLETLDVGNDIRHYVEYNPLGVVYSDDPAGQNDTPARSTISVNILSAATSATSATSFGTTVTTTEGTTASTTSATSGSSETSGSSASTTSGTTGTSVSTTSGTSGTSGSSASTTSATSGSTSTSATTTTGTTATTVTTATTAHEHVLCSVCFGCKRYSPDTCEPTPGPCICPPEDEPKGERPSHIPLPDEIDFFDGTPHDPILRVCSYAGCENPSTPREVCPRCFYCRDCDWKYFGTVHCTSCGFGSDCIASKRGGDREVNEDGTEKRRRNDWCGECALCKGCCEHGYVDNKYLGSTFWTGFNLISSTVLGSRQCVYNTLAHGTCETPKNIADCNVCSDGTNRFDMCISCTAVRFGVVTCKGCSRHSDCVAAVQNGGFGGARADGWCAKCNECKVPRPPEAQSCHQKSGCTG